MQTTLESIANLRATEANTAATEQSTFERKETFGVRKQAMELEYTKSEALFYEWMKDKPTRDALYALNYTRASQLHKALSDNPELVVGQMSVELELKNQKLSVMQANQKYGMEYAYAQAIRDALKNNNPGEATRLGRMLDQESIEMTGNPIDLGVEGLSLSDPNFNFTHDHIPMVESFLKMAKARSDHGKAKELLEIQTQPQHDWLDLINQQQDITSGGLKIDSETRKQAGQALYGLPVAFTEGLELASDGSIVDAYSQNQLSNLQEVFALLKSMGMSFEQVQQAAGKDLTVSKNMDLPGLDFGLGGGDNVDFIHPTDPNFNIDEYRQRIASFANSRGIDPQTAADVMTQQLLNEWAGSFSNMVTSGPRI